jgi:hypothetical protein
LQRCRILSARRWLQVCVHVCVWRKLRPFALAEGHVKTRARVHACPDALALHTANTCIGTFLFKKEKTLALACSPGAGT